MNRAHLTLLAGVCFATCAARAATPDPKLVALVERAKQQSAAVTDGSGITRELEALAKQISAFGPAAVPWMVPLLADPSAGVRAFAGFVVRDLPGLTPRELPALMASHRGGNGWIAPAIARVGTREAVDFLLQEFRRAPEKETQLGWALIGLGGRVAAPLAEQFRGLASPSQKVVNGTCGLFVELKDGAAAAEPVLLGQAQAEAAPRAARAVALRLLSCLANVRAETKAAVDKLVAADPGLASDAVVRAALMSMRTALGAHFALEKVREHPSNLYLLQGFGEEARFAEPEVRALLSDENPITRASAATTLGTLGSAASVPDLVRLLADPVDWRMPCLAARALAALRATSSASALDVLATHWYPPVRQCGAAAAAALKAGRPPDPKGELSEVPDGKKWRVSPPPPGVPEADVLSTAELKRMTVPAEEGGLAPRVPAQTGLKFAGGVLLGTDHGEWGGRLVWKGSRGEQTLVPTNLRGKAPSIASNVLALHGFGTHAVSLHGLAHMSLDEGTAYRITRGADGTVVATLWRVLPGSPEKSIRLADGSLFISCQGGDVILTANGDLRMASGPTP